LASQTKEECVCLLNLLVELLENNFIKIVIVLSIKDQKNKLLSSNLIGETHSYIQAIFKSKEVIEKSE
jgi:hypothetical protein